MPQAALQKIREGAIIFSPADFPWGSQQAPPAAPLPRPRVAATTKESRRFARLRRSIVHSQASMLGIPSDNAKLHVGPRPVLAVSCGRMTAPLMAPGRPLLGTNPRGGKDALLVEVLPAGTRSRWKILHPLASPSTAA